jgi:glycosyltransferase involved in cell wall biosynthesis
MGLGGEQRLVHDLAAARAPDMELSVWSLRLRDLPGTSERLCAAGVPYRTLAVTRSNPFGLFRFRSMLQRAKPDVLHLHLEYSALIGSAAARSLGRSRPLVVMSIVNDPHRHAPIHRRAARLLAPNVDLHLTISPGLKKAVLQAYGPGARRVEIVNPGIDLRRFDPASADPRRVAEHRRGAGRVVGTVARLAAQKAVHVLLDATPRLLADDPTIRVLIVGDGPLRETLEQQACRLGIAHAVSFAGYQEDVVSAYQAMDVFVLPSRDEGYGVVFLEAMAMGVPVVGTRVIGSEDAVEDRVTGLLVPHGDAPALAEAVRRILGDPALANRLRDAASDRVRRGFSRERWTSQVERLYRELAAGRLVPVSA